MVHWEDFGLVLVYSLGSLVWLFVLTKLMGNRQMSQLTLFDYIIGISIGSIAAEMASHPEEDDMAGADRHDHLRTGGRRLQRAE